MEGERRRRVWSSCGGWESDLVDGSNLEAGEQEVE